MLEENWTGIYRILDFLVSNHFWEKESLNYDFYDFMMDYDQSILPS